MTADIQVGPYRFGMSVEEARAANPDAAWETETFENRGEIRLLKADQGLPFAGQLFDVFILPGHYGGYRIEFASRTMVDMDACQADVVAAVGALEEQLGAFNRYGQAGVDAPAGDAPAGELSSVEVDRDRVNALWQTERVAPTPSDAYYARVDAHFNGRGDAAGCFITAQINRDPPAEQFVEPVTGVSFLSEAPIGVLHHSLDGVDLASREADVTVRCGVSWSEGDVTGCGPVPSADDPGGYREPTQLERAASARAEAMRADPASIDPFAPLAVPVDVTLRLSASDRASPGPPENVRSAREIMWLSQPERYEIEDEVMTVRPIDDFDVWRVVPFDLTITCQIQKDLSLVCTDYATSTGEPIPPGINPFALAGRYKSADAFEDGSPAAGAWVSIPYLADGTGPPPELGLLSVFEALGEDRPEPLQ